MALSSRLTFFSWVLISDIKTCWTLGKQEFSFNKKKLCDLQFAQYFFCCTLYLVYNKEFPLVYLLG